MRSCRTAMVVQALQSAERRQRKQTRRSAFFSAETTLWDMSLTQLEDK